LGVKKKKRGLNEIEKFRMIPIFGGGLQKPEKGSKSGEGKAQTLMLGWPYKGEGISKYLQEKALLVREGEERVLVVGIQKKPRSLTGISCVPRQRRDKVARIRATFRFEKRQPTIRDGKNCTKRNHPENKPPALGKGGGYSFEFG